MIRTEREYEETQRRLDDVRGSIEAQREALAAAGLARAHVELARSPMLTMQDRLAGDLVWYERAWHGEIQPLPNLTNIRLSLIARGLTQRQLARRNG